MAEIPSRIRRVELRCSDIESSAAFYASLLGLELAERGPERAELAAPGGTSPLLVLRRAQRPGPAPRFATGLFHTAFRYSDRPALAAALRRISAELDVELTGASDHGVSEALYLDDPDGLGIEIYRDRPRAEWPAPQGGERVHMFTAPLDLADLARADDGSGGGEGAARGLDIGHVHLKVSDPEAAIEFWATEIGMELMTRFGRDAGFLAFDGYHHHIGVNCWLSRGASPEPAEGPGLDAVALAVDPPPGELETPDGIRIR